jgi:hypothetical protein
MYSSAVNLLVFNSYCYTALLQNMEFLIYDRQYLLKDIASGQFDKYLVPFAQSLARDGK